jgi:nitrogen regulatory protein P-II 1
MFPHRLILTVVTQGSASTVMRAARKAGAEGGTVLPAFGTGRSDLISSHDVPFWPRREVVLTAVPAERTRDVLEAVRTAAALDRAGQGFACVLTIPDMVGLTYTTAS